MNMGSCARLWGSWPEVRGSGAVGFLNCKSRGCIFWVSGAVNSGIWVVGSEAVVSVDLYNCRVIDPWAIGLRRHFHFYCLNCHTRGIIGFVNLLIKSMEQTTSWEVGVHHLLKTISAFYKIRKSMAMFTTARHQTPFHGSWMRYTATYTIYLRYRYIRNPSHLHPVLPNSFFLPGFPIKILY
jgi:hypothetical protein